MSNNFTKKVALTFGALLLAAGITTTKAQAGAALNFVSTAPTDNVILPQAISTNSLVGGSKISIEAWVRPTSLAGNGCIVSNFANPANQLQFLLRRNGNAYLFFVGPGNAAAYSGVITAANTATINTWQHIAAVYDGTITTLYINGVFSASAATAANYTFAANSNPIIVGTNGAGGGEPFDGDIDELRIWNTNRTRCEINTFMNCEIPTNATNLIANYHFNQGIAASSNSTITTLIDGTSNAHTGTLTSFALTGPTSNWITPGGVVSGFTTALSPPSLTINANPSLSTCQNNTIILTASGASTYTWSGGVTNGVAFSATASTIYTVAATATNGCTNTSIASVTANICPGAALNFSLTSNVHAVLPTAISTNSLVGGNKITVEAWVRPTAMTVGSGCIAGNFATPANQITFLLRRSGSLYQFFVGSPSAYSNVNSVASSATLNTWQHVAGTYDGTIAAIYINGVLSASAALGPYTFGVNTNSITVGWEPAGGGAGEQFEGDIDELRIWNINRSKCQINTFMNCEIPTNAPNLIANYHFNQGQAFSTNTTVTVLNDATSNAFNGTLNNLALTGLIKNWVSPGGVVSGFTTSLASPSFTNSALAICPGGSVVLGSTGATSFTWNPAITNNSPFTPSVSATYSYVGTNSVSACTNSSVANVTVNPSPTISVNSGSICSGNSFTINPSGASTYTIQGGNAVVSPTTNNTYTVIGTSSLGCLGANTATSNVTVNQIPNVVAATSASSFICAGQSATLTAGGANTYVWNTTATTAVIVISPTVTTSYTVTGTDANGCQNMAAITQSVNSCSGLNTNVNNEFMLEIFPNPSNGVFNLKVSTEMYIEVFNLLGNVVLSTKLNSGEYKLNLSEHSKGVYIIKCTSQGHIKSYRLIKD